MCEKGGRGGECVLACEGIAVRFYKSVAQGAGDLRTVCSAAVGLSGRIAAVRA